LSAPKDAREPSARARARRTRAAVQATSNACAHEEVARRVDEQRIRDIRVRTRCAWQAHLVEHSRDGAPHRRRLHA